jgi:TolB-like protein/DNA-binding winged helix-turn-helix (wHTH) protein
MLWFQALACLHCLHASKDVLFLKVRIGYTPSPQLGAFVAPSTSREIVRFEEFEADLRSRELLRSGAKVRLPDQSFEVLAMLLEHPGELVSREQVRERLWPTNTFVDFDHGLNNAVNRLRDALRESAESPRFIETLPRRGYRFIGTIDQPNTPVPELEAEHLAPSHREAETARIRQWQRPVALSATVVCLLTASLLAFTQRVRLFGRSPANAKSIAVLPLRNLSGDPKQDYFSDSMTEELITQLAKTSSLRVVSSASVMRYKNANPAVSDIQRDLKVDVLVEGGVLRSGDKVRITAQLIDASTDRHIWAEDYEGEMRDVLFLQNNIASAIAAKVRAEITPSELSKRSPPHQVDPRAYDAYIQGRGYWFRSNTHGAQPDDLAKSGEKFRLAIKYDPNYALAYAGLAGYYGLEAGYGAIPPADGWRLSEEASRKALSLDDSLAEAHCALATKMMLYDWNWAGAEREMLRGLDSDPHYAELHHMYSLLLAYTGRFDQSIAEAHRAEELDPLGQGTVVQRALLFGRRYDLFLQEVDKVFADDPARIHKERARVAKARKQFAREVAETNEELRLEGCIVCAERLARAYATAGYRGWLQARLLDLKKRSKQEQVSPFDFAEIYAAMGNADLAIKYLEAAYREHTFELVRLQVNPAYDSLHSDPRYRDLVRRIGLPQ